jgi:hypothetical protein
LSRRVSTQADAARYDEFVDAAHELCRVRVLVRPAHHVSDFKNGVASRPEGIRGQLVAFPEFAVADLTFCRPFPERNLFTI